MSAAIGRVAAPPAQEGAACAHCGAPAPPGRRFCCAGCAAAFETIQGLGLGRYYRQRLLDPASRPPRPEATEPRHDLARHVRSQGDGRCELTLAIDGLHCGACVWLIESILGREPSVLTGRVNLTTRRLRLVWQGAVEDAGRLVGLVEALGYRLVPFDPAALAAAEDRSGRDLIRALGIAGFAAGNVMLISIGEWAGAVQDMGPATRSLLHWVTALLALPAVVLAGRPFYRSALAALRRGRTNMDVPISLGVVLVSGISLADTFGDGAHTYYESALMLLFFLLLGRVLDHRARGRARATAEQLLTLRAGDVAVLTVDGRTVRRAQEQVAPGDRVLVGMGERIGVDGVVETGAAAIDASLVTGESLPAPVAPGGAVFAGSLNLGAALVVRATATGSGTLLAECVRLIETAEARRGQFVVLADRVARAYAPAVHGTALAAFLGWMVLGGAPVGQALLIASAVLIVTCPCAVALAVPAVQVIAASRLFRGGMLLKSATALERLAEVDTVVFDKTGTLSEPTLALEPLDDAADEAAKAGHAAALAVAASLAAASRHPLARALAAAAGPVAAADGVTEHPGAGLSLATTAGEIRLGSRGFCRGAVPLSGGEGDPPTGPAPGPELWLARPGHPPLRFGFAERPRADAAAVVARLRGMGLAVRLLSGDSAASVTCLAAAVGIADWQAGCSPVEKATRIEDWAGAGRRVLMVGDGLNDSPALAAAL
ncbi:MAG: heavy metal translocating P-type ATPase metal-binding domain-containing protein, partial [Rhodospirillales bacterium]|nr:heavy metal translocating P-type ATPase metal-binding domain-containing protein [Rhodospirillales bacterium]